MIAALDLQFECLGGAVGVVQALVGPLLRRDCLGGAGEEVDKLLLRADRLGGAVKALVGLRLLFEEVGVSGTAL